MSPTLLELVIVVFLLLLAWRAAVLIAPLMLASFVSFWRGPKPPSSPSGPGRVEKNVTPPPEPGSTARKNHGLSSK